jgi:hypothetical protein
MAAHPKNKVTRVEQGKRRAGNTPKLLKDTKMSVIPMHKRGFFGKVMAWFGEATIVEDTTKADKKAARKAARAGVSGTGAAQAKGKPQAKIAAPSKKVARTQHKGS